MSERTELAIVLTVCMSPVVAVLCVVGYIEAQWAGVGMSLGILAAAVLMCAVIVGLMELTMNVLDGINRRRR